MGDTARRRVVVAAAAKRSKARSPRFAPTPAALRQAAVKNFLVVTGDLHTHIASDIKFDYTSPNLIDTSNYLGAEFMTPSITSSTLGEMVAANADPKLREVLVQGLVAPAVQVANPHIRFFNSSSST